MNKQIKMKSILILAFLFLFMISPSPRPDEQRKTKPPEVRYDVTVRLKLFDVLVLDDDDKPVKNLRKDQFRLFIDGKQVDIDTFDFMDYSIPEKKSRVQRAKTEPVKSPQESITAVQDSIEDKRLFIIIFQNLPWAKPARREIAEGLFAFIDSHQNPNDYYAIYYFPGPDVSLLLPFTNNKEQIKSTVSEMFVNNKHKFIPYLPLEIKHVVFLGGKQARWISEGYDAYTMTQMSRSWYILDTLIRSFSFFKCRKEVLLFSDSITIPRYGPSGGKGILGFKYERLIFDSQSSNITFNTFNLDRRTGFDMSGGHVDEFEQGALANISRMGLKKNLREDMRSLATDTDGLYVDRAFRKNILSAGLEEIYLRSSSFYYLGVQLNDLRWYDGLKHQVEIKVDVEDAKLYYQKSFRFEPDIKKMDENDKLSQFLDALFGLRRFDTLQMTETAICFPYGEKSYLLVNDFYLPYIEKDSDRITVALRYYDYARMFDRQFYRIWDIEDERENPEVNSARFLVGVPLEPGEYAYRYVVRDEDSGKIRNGEYVLSLGKTKKYISSIVLFGTAAPSAVKTNLLDFSESKREEEEQPAGDELVIDPSLNPFNYDGKILLPLLNEAIFRGKDAYIMFMYNNTLINKDKLDLSFALTLPDGTVIQTDFQKAEQEKEFPGGWRRVTLKLPLEEIPVDINELKFTVSVKDQSGKEIDSESLDIKLM